MTVAVLAVGLRDTGLDIYLCVTNPAVYDDKLVSRYAARSGLPRDDKSSH